MRNKDIQRFERALQWHQSGALADAEAEYRQILKASPKHVEAVVNLAIILRDSGRADESLGLLKRALRRRPDSIDIKNELALALLKLQRFDAAEDVLRDILGQSPDSYTARSNLGSIMMQTARYGEAVRPFEEAVARYPDMARAHDQLGSAWFALGRMADAEACYRAALKVSPDYAAAWNHLGDVYRVEGAFEDADKYYRKAVEIAPNYAMARWNRAMGLLSAGDYEAGWRAYGARFDAGVAQRESCALPVWQGEPLAGRRILVYAEQGVGDEIMFSAFLPHLAKMAGHVTLVCEQRLEALFARSFPGITIRGWRRESAEQRRSLEQDADVWLQLGDLPALIWHGVWNVAAGAALSPAAYLTADGNQTAMWRARYAALGSGLKVGLSWRGGGGELVRHRRSLALASWARILRHDSLHVINLQYGECGAELAAAERLHNLRIADWEDSDPLADLDGFAAQIAALDLVISVDNATVHMAGALGRPVWAVLPNPADWRWGRSGDDNIWYGSVRLFRQIRPGDWAPALGHLSDALQEFLVTETHQEAVG